MRCFSRVASSLIALLMAATMLVAPVPSGVNEAEASSKTPIMRDSQLTPAQIAGWFKATTGSPYRASVPVEFLAAYYVFEGAAEGVSGDIAFAQAVVETGWFAYGGQVTPSHNNFAGIGACDGGFCTVATFPTARMGVRAQIQHLRAYADPNVTVSQLAYPLESPRFDLVQPKGRAPNWEDLGGLAADGKVQWASDPDYASKVLAQYASMQAYAQKNPGLGGTWLFSDVPAGHTFESDIIRLAIADVTRGCGTTRYCPEQVVTREQMASFMVRALDLPRPSGNRFKDVSSSNQHQQDINALAEAGITRGCNPPANDRFCPKDAVSRAQMASFIIRALDGKGSDYNRFSDVSARNPHRADINALAERRITRGCNPPHNTRFCPSQSVTRGEMAAFLGRAFL